MSLWPRMPMEKVKQWEWIVVEINDNEFDALLYLE